MKKGINIIEQKKAALQSLRAQIDELENDEWLKTEYPALKKLEGRHFRIRNCYSCPRGPEDYWWLYRTLVKVTRERSIVVNDFEVDKDGQLRVERRTLSARLLHNENPITAREWQKGLRQARAVFNRLAAMEGA